MNKKIKTILLVVILLILILFAIFIGYTFANPDFNLLGNSKTITSGHISMTYTESTNVINLSGLDSVSDKEAKVSDNYFSFSVSKNTSGNIKLGYAIYFSDVSTNTLPYNAVKLFLTKVNNVNDAISSEKVVISSKTLDEFSGFNTLNYTINNSFSDKLIYYKYFNSSNLTETDNYRLRLWISDEYNLNDNISSSVNGGNTHISMDEMELKFKVNIVEKIDDDIYERVNNCSLDDVGCEVIIGNEHFYVIGDDSNISGNVNLLAKYNLKINDYADYQYGNNSFDIIDSYKNFSSNDLDYKMQSSDSFGWKCDKFDSYNRCVGILSFSGGMVFGEENYRCNDYKEKVNSLYHVLFDSCSLITYDQLETLGCDITNLTCNVDGQDLEWLYSSSYFVYSDSNGGRSSIDYDGSLNKRSYHFIGMTIDKHFGFRPVISVSKSLFQ